MTAPVCCFTSVSYATLPLARVLVQTLRAAHPDWALHAVMVDKPPPGFDPARVLAEFDHVVHAHDLSLPYFRAWMFKHDRVEACAAVKAQMLVETLAAGFAKVVFLAAGIAVFHPLTDIVDRLDTASIILAPHQAAPNDGEAAVADNELASLPVGVYDTSFLAVRNDAAGQAFARWWAQRLQAACHDDPARGLYRDARYCDLVPALFGGVHVERDPGVNVSSVNLSRRRLRFMAGQLTADGTPLRFFNFGGGGEDAHRMTERYAGDNTEVFEVLRWFRGRVAALALPGVGDTYWHYGQFVTGIPILHAARQLFRDRPDLMAQFPDPFAMHRASFHAWLQANAPDCLAHVPRPPVAAVSRTPLPAQRRRRAARAGAASTVAAPPPSRA